MGTRLQVVLEDTELKEFRRIARGRGLTLAEWVRQALRRVGREEPAGDPERKLAYVRAASQHAFPAPDVDQMLAEIERGYTQE